MVTDVGRWWRLAVLGLLGLLFVTSGLYQAAHDSATVDEAVDIASGVTILTRHDLRLSPEHDLLVHVLSEGPALLARPVIPDGPGYRSGDWFAHTDEFMRANRAAGKLDRILLLSRLVPLLEGLAAAAALYLLTDRLLGSRSATVATALWLSTPLVVGFSHVVSIDMTFALSVITLCLALEFDGRRRSLRSALLVGAALGAALLARHSGLVLVPAAALTALVTRRSSGIRARLAAVSAMAVAAWVAVWIAFVAFGSSLNPVASSRFDGLIGHERSHSILVRLVLSVPWPKEWAGGLAYLSLTSTPRPAYLFGQAWVGGRWWFFPGSFILKAPGGLLAAVVLVPVGLWRLNPETRRRIALVLVPVVGALAMQLLLQPLDLGLRYALPVVALGLVPAAAIASWACGRVAIAGLTVLAVTQLGAFVAASPHSIAWTPPPFRSGFRWASDSNVDYGQDERAVERWSIGKAPLVALLLPRGVDIPPSTHPLLGLDPAATTGWVAVSATRLTVLNREALSWLRAYCPTTTINGSVLVYRFATPPDARPGPVIPTGVCHSEYSHRG